MIYVLNVAFIAITEDIYLGSVLVRVILCDAADFAATRRRRILAVSQRQFV